MNCGTAADAGPARAREAAPAAEAPRNLRRVQGVAMGLCGSVIGGWAGRFHFRAVSRCGSGLELRDQIPGLYGRELWLRTMLRLCAGLWMK